MTVFKAFLKILKNNMFPVILYTLILIIFGVLNMRTSENNVNFVAVKPDIVIINDDVNDGITSDLMRYMKENCNVKNIAKKDIDDALFYRDLNLVMYIPENFNEDFMNGENPQVKVKKTGDYNSSLAEMMLEKYLNVASSYLEVFDSVDEIILNVNETLGERVEVSVTSKLDTANLNKATFYFNFMNYAILASAIFVICLILNSFKGNVKKRIIVSSMNFRRHNRILLGANLLFVLVFWLCYMVLSIIILGKVMFSGHGVLYMLNSLVFTICAVAIAFLINNLNDNKDAINGIINVVALGSSFLTGVFVPREYLPDAVLNVSKILPSSWFVKTNDMIKTIEVLNFTSIKPLLFNMGIILIFTLGFVVAANLVSRYRRKLG